MSCRSSPVHALAPPGIEFCVFTHLSHNMTTVPIHHICVPQMYINSSERGTRERASVMVLCINGDYLTKSGWDKVGFYSVPAIITNQGPEFGELTQKRRHLRISTIDLVTRTRGNQEEKILQTKWRVYSWFRLYCFTE